MTTTYTLHTNRDISPSEFGQLAALAHWGEPQDFTADRLAAHFTAVDFVAHIRDQENRLVGYAAAISNGLGSVYLDSLLTHPEFDRCIIGSLLLKAVLAHFPNRPSSSPSLRARPRARRTRAPRRRYQLTSPR